MPIRVTVGAGFAVICGVILTFAALTSPVHAQGQGNSAAAKLCQHGGWQDLTTADGQAFKNQGACTSYASHGGTLVPASPWHRECVARGGEFSDDGNWTCNDIDQDTVDYLDRLCTEAGGDPGEYTLPDGQVIVVGGAAFCRF